MINDVTRLPLYLEPEEIKKLQEEQDQVMLHGAMDAEPGMDAKYFPAATMRLAADAIREEYLRQGADNRTLRAVIGQLTDLGVDFSASPNP